MTDGGAGTSRIGAHDSILETRAELGCAPLEGNTIFESPRGHHFSVFMIKRDDLDGVEGARRHLVEVGEDARSHPGGAVRLPVFTSLGAASTMHLYLASLTVW